MRRIARNNSKKMCTQELVVNLDNTQMDINLGRDKLIDVNRIYNTKESNDELMRNTQKKLLPQVKGDVEYVEYIASIDMGTWNQTTGGYIKVNELGILDDMITKDFGIDATYINVRKEVQTKEMILANIKRTIKKVKKDKTKHFLPDTVPYGAPDPSLLIKDSKRSV